MPLFRERSLWEWAQKIAKEHDDNDIVVLVELLKAIERNELPATFSDGRSSKQHDFKPLIEELLAGHSAGIIVLYTPNWDAISGITLKSSDVESWLAHITSTKPKPASTANLPTGMPGRPSKGKDIIDKEFARRAVAGKALCVISHEAKALRNWYQNKYPDAQIPKQKTTENNIRAVRAAHRNPDSPDRLGGQGRRPRKR